MQSGTTGTNALRIYSPLRQAHVQDPTGAFIRRWVPELQAVPTSYIHSPHLMPPLVQQSCGVIIGRDYPLPVVDEQQALAIARAKLSAARKGLRTDDEARAHTAALLVKHGSRKPPARRRTPAATQQPLLPLSFANTADDDGMFVVDDDDDGEADA
jgi:deoxyribodipyrimidine photo-lyase